MNYQSKKSFYSKVLTIYGRKPVLEALQDRSLSLHRLHLADSNKEQTIIRDIKRLAEQREVETLIHSKQELSRISKNAKQDQGVALDILCPQFSSLEDWLEDNSAQDCPRLIALDNIHNPQNLGMIIRSVAAAGVDGLLLSSRGNAAIGPLVIKASAGTLFKAPIIHCDSLPKALSRLRETGFACYALRGDADDSLFDYARKEAAVFVMGNETEGVSRDSSALCEHALLIPMANGVESLNVAVSAALVAFQIKR